MKTKLNSVTRGLRKARSGASTVEYGILIALTAVAAIGSVVSFSSEVSTLFGGTGVAVSGARATAASAGAGGGPVVPETEETAPEGLEFIVSGATTIGFDTLTGVGPALIEWGDGTSTNFPYRMNQAAWHTYDTPGTYTVRITGGMTKLTFPASATQVVTWGQVPLVNLDGAFASQGITSLPSWLPSSVTDLSYAFGNNPNEISGPSTWDVSGVRDMERIFFRATAAPDISGWDTSSVTTLEEAFAEGSVNVDVTGWNVRNVANMDRMLADNPIFSQDLSGWCVEDIASTPTGFIENADGMTDPALSPRFGEAC